MHKSGVHGYRRVSSIFGGWEVKDWERSATDLLWKQISDSPDYCRSSRIVRYKSIAKGAVRFAVIQALAGKVSVILVCWGSVEGNRVN